MQKKVLITGVTGQDGSYLAEQLLAGGHEVYGLVRRTSRGTHDRIDHLLRRERPLILLSGNLSDAGSVRRAVETVEPDEVYHLGAQSHVGLSFTTAPETLDVTGIGTLRLLEAVADVKPNARVYSACSSEIFGNTPGPLSETSTIAPVSPYGAAKVMALHACRQARDRGLFVSSGILFNHCSPRQAPEFLPAKVCRAAIAAVHGDHARARITLGNLDAQRDWGWAPDYTAFMPQILRHHEPVELVIGTGRSWSVRAVCATAFHHVGLDYEEYVTLAKSDRPLEIWDLVADTSRAASIFGAHALPVASLTRLISQMLAGLGYAGPGPADVADVNR